MVKQVTIDCGEILLREYRLDDVEALYQITAQPEVYEFISGSRATREQRTDWMIHYEIPANEAFLAAVPNLDEVGWLNLGIILKETGEFIGFCNTGIKEELPEPNREIGYAISKHFRNKGYSTLAAKGLVNYLFTHTNVEFLNAVALTTNGSSRRVLEKVGFKQVGEVMIDGEPYSHYQILKQL